MNGPVTPSAAAPIDTSQPAAALCRPPQQGQYRDFTHHEAESWAQALIRAANYSGWWRHLPEHLIQLRAVWELTASPFEHRIDQPVPNPNSPTPAVRPSCPVCFRWLDGPLLECRRVGCPTNPDVADETAEPKE